MERIVPIYDDTRRRGPKPAKAESNTKPSKSKTIAKGTLADLLAGLLSGLAALVAFGYSLLFFTRFLENDTHLWGIISAFILCFGVGAFGYVPAAINAVIAFKDYKNGSDTKNLIWSLVLTLPWFILSLILVFISDMPKIYAIPIFITATLLLGWTTVSLSRTR